MTHNQRRNHQEEHQQQQQPDWNWGVRKRKKGCTRLSAHREKESWLVSLKERSFVEVGQEAFCEQRTVLMEKIFNQHPLKNSLRLVCFSPPISFKLWPDCSAGSWPLQDDCFSRDESQYLSAAISWIDQEHELVFGRELIESLNQKDWFFTFH